MTTTKPHFENAHRGGGGGGGAPHVPPQKTLKNCNIKMQHQSILFRICLVCFFDIIQLLNSILISFNLFIWSRDKSSVQIYFNIYSVKWTQTKKWRKNDPIFLKNNLPENPFKNSFTFYFKSNWKFSSITRTIKGQKRPNEVFLEMLELFLFKGRKGFQRT